MTAEPESVANVSLPAVGAQVTCNGRSGTVKRHGKRKGGEAILNIRGRALPALHEVEQTVTEDVAAPPSEAKKGKGKSAHGKGNAPSSTKGKGKSKSKSTTPTVDLQNEICNHCRRKGHTAKTCIYGAEPHERFLRCLKPEQCFPRQFLVLLRRAKPKFDIDNLRDGRIDVGVSSVSAALFRSQSIRHNTSIGLLLTGDETSATSSSSSASAKCVTFYGALVRDLKCDDRSLAERLLMVSGETEDETKFRLLREEADRGAWSSSPYRGILGVSSDSAEILSNSLTRCLRPSNMPGLSGDFNREAFFGGQFPCAASTLSPERVCSSGPIVFLLSGGSTTNGSAAVGRPIEDVITEIQASEPSRERLHRYGVVCILGDDRGLTEADEKVVEAATACDERLYRVTLGSEILFTNQCVVLVHHYLDKLAHACALPPPRKLATNTWAGRGKPRAKGGGKASR
eukprot:g12605.t1